MSVLKNYLPLNIEPFLKVDLNYIESYKRNDAIMTRFNVNDIINTDTLLKLNKIIGTPISHCVLFSTGPSFTLNIHKDSGEVQVDDEEVNVWAINFIINSSHHEMIWYHELSKPVKILNKIGSYYYHYDETNTKEIERFTITQPTLIRTDVPHNVINYDEKNFRYCISIRSKTSKLSWSEVYNIFLNFR
jgi:hypothetical protein